MITITKKQKQIIIAIEVKLGIIYKTPNEGRTVASRFIAKHIEALREYNRANNLDAPPTGKQDRCIKAIEKEFDVVFEGRTLFEANDFIKEFQLIRHGIYI